MKTSLIILFAGPDRAGIVDTLSRIVFAHEASWEQSRMLRLAGRGTGLLKISVEEEKADALVEALKGVESLQMLVERGTTEPTPMRSMRLELTGTDRLGIVQDIAAILKKREINIEEMTTEQVEGPMTGRIFFGVVAELTSDPDVDVEALRRELYALAAERSVRITLESVQWEM